MNIRDYIRFSRRWVPIALGAAIVAALLTYGFSKYAIRPLYTSSVVMQVQLGITAQDAAVDPTFNANFATTEAAVAEQAPNVNQALALSQRQLGTVINASELKTIRSSIGCRSDAITALFACSATSHSAAAAAAVANNVARVFIANERAWQNTRYQTLIKRIQKQETGLQRTLSQEQDQLRQLQGNRNADPGQVSSLTTQVNTDQSRYNDTVQLETNIRQAAAQQASIVRVVSDATPPTHPSSPHSTLNAALAFFLILALVIVGGITAEHLDDSLRGEDELKEVTGLPILGVVPSVDSLKEAKASPSSLVVASQLRSPVSEAFRVVRTGITFSRIDNPPRVLMITSAVQGEGKSTVAANLAVTFAETGKSVILVDLDLRRPSVSALFDTPKHGITNLLLDPHGDPRKFLAQTHVANLRVLPSGPLPPNPAELISSHRMGQVIGELKDMADLVIIDSPPVLAVADATVATSLADAVVLVIRPDRIKRRSLQQAVQTLRTASASLVGVLVNSLDRNRGSYYYSYGYYYYQGYYSNPYLTESNGHAGEPADDLADVKGESRR